MPDTGELTTILDAPPGWELYVLIGVGVCALVMWMLGRKLARPACAVGGLVMGGLTGFTLSHSLGVSATWLFVLVVGAAIAGCLVAWFMFRLWMGMSAAVILGLAVPAAVLVVQGVPELPAAEAEVHAEDAGAPMQFDAPDADAEQATIEEQARAIIAPMLTALGDEMQRQLEAVRAFWDGLGSKAQWTLLTAAFAGASFGLVAGLIAPYFAASVQTALVGGMLLLGVAIRLSHAHLPESARFLPAEVRGRLLLLGLITLAGVGIQWTLSAKRTDK